MTAALKRQQEFDISTQTAQQDSDAVGEMDPYFAQALQDMFAAYDRGLRPKLEVRGNPFDAIMKLREQLRSAATEYSMDDPSVDAMDDEVTHSTAEAAKGKGLNDVKVTLTVSDKPLPVDKSMYNFMRTWDRNGQRNGAGYGSRIMKLTASGTKTSEMPDQDQLYMNSDDVYVVLHVQGIQSDGVDGLDEVAAALVDLAVAAGPGVAPADMQDMRTAIVQGKTAPAQQELTQKLANLNHVAHVVSRAPETVADAPAEIKTARNDVLKKMDAAVTSPALMNAVISSTQRSEAVAARQVQTPKAAAPVVLKADNNNTINIVKPATPAAPKAEAPAAQKIEAPAASAPVAAKIEAVAVAPQSVRVEPVAVAPAAVSPVAAPAQPVMQAPVARPVMPEAKAPEAPRAQPVETRSFVQAPALVAPAPVMQQPAAYVAPVQSAPSVQKVETQSYTAPTQAAPVVAPVQQVAESVKPVQAPQKIETAVDKVEEDAPDVDAPRAAVKPNVVLAVNKPKPVIGGVAPAEITIGDAGVVPPVAVGPKAVDLAGSDANAPDVTEAQKAEQTQAVEMKAAQDTITSVAASLGVSATSLNISAAEIAGTPQVAKQSLQQLAQKTNIQQMMDSQIVLDREEGDAEKRKEQDKFLKAQEKEADEKKAKEKKEHEAAMARAASMSQPTIQTMMASEIVRPKAAEQTQAQIDYDKFFKKDEIKTTTSLSSSFNSACSGNCGACRGCSVSGVSRAPAPTV